MAPTNYEVANNLRWKKFNVLDQGHVCLVDHMGDDSSVVQAARVSYGNDIQFFDQIPEDVRTSLFETLGLKKSETPSEELQNKIAVFNEFSRVRSLGDRKLIRYMMSHNHGTPFEMCEVKFRIRIPMDCWRQMVRHRTANINEYSTRYTEAIDARQTTSPSEWRLQSSSNKQGSDGFLDEETGSLLSAREADFHDAADQLYKFRLKKGVAKEQARKDLPLSTYTELYWKCDLRNIFHFLKLRMDSHAQLEIRQYANAIAEIIKQLYPLSYEAFVDFSLEATTFSRLEILMLKEMLKKTTAGLLVSDDFSNAVSELNIEDWKHPNSREAADFKNKLSLLGIDTSCPQKKKE